MYDFLYKNLLLDLSQNLALKKVSLAVWFHFNPLKKTNSGKGKFHFLVTLNWMVGKI